MLAYDTLCWTHIHNSGFCTWEVKQAATQVRSETSCQLTKKRNSVALWMAMKRGRPFPELPTLWSTKPSLCFVWRAPPCIPLWWAPQWYWKPLLKSFGLLPHSYHPRRVQKSGCLFEWVLEALEGEKRELEKVVLDVSARGHVKALCSCARSASRGILAKAVHRAAVNPSKVWERKGGAETEAKHGRGNVTHGVTELPLVWAKHCLNPGVAGCGATLAQCIWQMVFTRDGLSVWFMSWSPGVNKTVLKTMSVMDLDKVNLELIEALLEWIVAGGHSYPPGNFTVLER